jgi:hypothetical protein
MSGPAQQQSRFAAALFDRELPVPEGVTSWTGPRPQRRFAVYRNNISSALIEALAIRYPVVMRLVGEEFFRAMTREYVQTHLPSSPVLIEYGSDYPPFISDFLPAAGLPYLADVARLESAYWEAYHAADGRPVDASAFAAVPPGRLPGLRLAFLPSVRVVTSSWPVVSIWRTNTHDIEVTPIDLSVAEDTLVARPELDVEIRRLPRGAASFLSRLMEGAPLGEAAGAAVAEDSDFDLAANLKGLIEARIIARLT